MELVIDALAAYRIARLIVMDEGPGGIFEHFRAWAGAYDLGVDAMPETRLGRAVSCMHCIGVYAAFVVVLMRLGPHPFALLREALAVAGAVTVGTIWLQHLSGKRFGPAK